MRYKKKPSKDSYITYLTKIITNLIKNNPLIVIYIRKVYETSAIPLRCPFPSALNLITIIFCIWEQISVKNVSHSILNLSKKR